MSDFSFIIDDLNVEVESDTGFYLPQPAIQIINSLLPALGGTIPLNELNTEATTEGTQLNSLLTFAGYISQFPLPTSASLDTVITIEMSEVLDNESIIDIDTIWLHPLSGLHVVVHPQYVPSGIGIRLDTLHLVFPSSIHLDVNYSEYVRSNHVFIMYNVPISEETGLDFRVPIAFMTDLFDNGIVALTDSIKVYARYSLTGAYDGVFFPSTPETSTRLDLHITPNLTIQSANVTVTFDNDISVDLSDLPEILMDNRENLVLDVNPHLRLQIDGNLDVSTTLYLEPFRNGVATESVTIPLNLTPGENQLWIAGNDNSPSNYEFIEANLRALILTIPDSIVIRMGQSRATFGFDTDYYANMTAQFVVPLEFGPKFSAVIEDTFHLDAVIGEMISGNSIGLSVRTRNTIPLDLTATATPIDEQGRVLDIDVSEFTIRAGSTMDSLPERLVFNDRDTDLLQYMRGLVFRIEIGPGRNTPGQALRPENFIQIRLNARIEGGVTVDLNNL
jgi:hypothetical protein